MHFTQHPSQLLLKLMLLWWEIWLPPPARSSASIMLIPANSRTSWQKLSMHPLAILCQRTSRSRVNEWFVVSLIYSLPLRNSRISVIPNDLPFIRNYISHICFDCVKQFYHWVLISFVINNPISSSHHFWISLSVPLSASLFRQNGWSQKSLLLINIDVVSFGRRTY